MSGKSPEEDLVTAAILEDRDGSYIQDSTTRGIYHRQIVRGRNSFAIGDLVTGRD